MGWSVRFMKELRCIICIHCDKERPPGRDACPHCGGQPLAHKQTPEEFQAFQKRLAGALALQRLGS